MKSEIYLENHEAINNTSFQKKRKRIKINDYLNKYNHLFENT